MPASVCQSRGDGLPAMGSRESPLVTMAPSSDKSHKCANSIPYPNVPDAAITGFRSAIPQSAVDSTSRAAAFAADSLLTRVAELTLRCNTLSR